MKLNLPYLKHIREELEFLSENSKDLSYDMFIADPVLKRSFARSFEIIGEAAKNLAQDFKNNHSGIEWRKLVGLRDKIIHVYFGVNYKILWHIITDKLPELKNQINEIIKKVENN